MEFESIRDQRDADQHQKRQRQHFGRRVLGDEMRDRSGCHIHHDDRDHDGCDHDLDVLRHADRGDDRVDREHQIDRHDLQHDHGEGRINLGGGRLGFVGLHLGVDLVRRLGDQKQSTGDQDHVVPGEITSEQSRDRIGQPHQIGQAEQQQDAEDKRERKADLARAARIARRAARHQHRNEHDVVDAEHDLERRQRDQRGPGIRIGQEVEHGVGDIVICLFAKPPPPGSTRR
jgi:hypothetical protein